jgi:hypothetical protein
MVEHDGVNRPGVTEQDRDRPGVDHRLPSGVFQPGMDPCALLDVQPITEQTPLLERVVDNIPAEIHQPSIAASTVGAVIRQ